MTFVSECMPRLQFNVRSDQRPCECTGLSVHTRGHNSIVLEEDGFNCLRHHLVAADVNRPVLAAKEKDAIPNNANKVARVDVAIIRYGRFPSTRFQSPRPIAMDAQGTVIEDTEAHPMARTRVQIIARKAGLAVMDGEADSGLRGCVNMSDTAGGKPARQRINDGLIGDFAAKRNLMGLDRVSDGAHENFSPQRGGAGESVRGMADKKPKCGREIMKVGCNKHAPADQRLQYYLEPSKSRGTKQERPS